MKSTCIFFLFLSFPFFLSAQTNLALSSTASASATSSGSYGPSNWTDGVINGSLFGWVGTDPGFFPPSYMEFNWSAAQSFDSVVIYNAGTNFAPPNGNAVVFSGTANLEYYDGSQWVQITSFTGQGTYGSSYSLIFAPVTTTRLRIASLVTTTGNHNPGFDEVEVYLSPQPVPVYDLELTQLDTTLIVSGPALSVSALITNVGTERLDTVELFYEVSNAGSAVSQVFYPALEPGEDTLLDFSQSLNLDSLPSALSTENLCVWVDVNRDVTSSNDSICYSLEALTETEFTLNEIKFYPNPASGAVVLQSDLPMDRVTIYDLKGAAVFSQELHSGFSANLSLDLPPGAYILNVEAKGSGYKERIILH